MVVGATTPNRWLLVVHIVSVTVGTILLVGHLFTLAGRRQPSERTESSHSIYQRMARVAGIVLVVAILFPVIATIIQHYRPNSDYLVRNPLSPPTSMYEEGGGTDGPFFPASVETYSGDLIPTDFFLTSETCAASGCHPDIYEQWNESAHHFASFNNQWYRKAIMYMQDVNGIQPSKWCGGCHDLAVLLNGVMDRPIRDNLHTPAAQAGLACTGCHSIEKVKDTMGNNGYVIKYPNLHNYLIRLDPQPHKNSFLKPFHRESKSEFCSTCHKVHLDEPVNNFRWFRGFDEYDQWQSSGVSHQGALSFYYPGAPKECNDCHMPPVPSRDAGNIDGTVHSHRFPAANTALPFVNKHDKQLKTVTEFLQANKVTVDIFALAPATPIQRTTQPSVTGRPSTFSMMGESAQRGGSTISVTDITKTVAPVNRSHATVQRGNEVRVDIVVRTRDVGHRFPAGTIDAFDIWLELKATDENGKVVFWNGRIDAADGNGPVDEGAHFYRAYMLDEHGNLINKRNAWATRTILYARTIPPGAADTVHYRLFVPEDCGDKIYLHAKLNYRKFNWWHTQWAYAGVRDPDDTDFQMDKGYDDGRWVFTGRTSDVAGEIKAIPNLPIVVMAEDTVALRVVDDVAAPKAPPPPAKEDRERWNDYGIGLFLQGDLKGAESVFLKVTEIDPGYMDGWVNVARCRIEEGNLSGAEEMLGKAFEIQEGLAPDDPHRAKVHYFYALAQKAYGKYDEALSHLRLAAAQFPRDRKVRNEMGRLLYLQRKYEQALEEFQKTLEVDPEDLDAHYNMMLCYRALKNEVMASREQKLYTRFKADESVDAITGITRRANPHANNERQPIHEHVSALGTQSTAYELPDEETRK
jgi:tetratricopeptide (TPR) repeat protein